MILGAALGGSGEAQADIDVTESPAPFGYFPLANFTAPFGLPGNCDDGGFILNVPAFDFNGNNYTSVIWSVNGTVEIGTASGLASAAGNVRLPDSALPNNLLAPLWTDLNLCAGGNLYVVILSGGGSVFIVFEWEDMPLFGNPSAYTFQIWIETTAENIWFTYDRIDSTSIAMTVGAENATGTDGDSYYYVGGATPEGIPPAVGVDLQVVTDPDDDGDGVADGEDECPNTAIPESVPTQMLLNNRYALTGVNDPLTFDSTNKTVFTTTDTRGCSCEQIIDVLSLGSGHGFFGCSKSVMRQFTGL